MLNQRELPEEERSPVLERLRNEGRVLGRAEGRAEGQRAALLRLASRLGLSMEELRPIESIDEVEQRITTALAKR